MNLKLNPGPIKDFVWKDRHLIAGDTDYLFMKFGALAKFFMGRGHEVNTARGLAFVFLAFPYRRSLKFFDERELCQVVSDLKKIVAHYESYYN